MLTELKSKAGWIAAILLLGVVLGMSVRGCVSYSTHVDSPATEYLVNLSANFADASQQVASGTLKTDRELFDYLAPKNKAAKAVFDSAFEEAMPDGEFGHEAKDVADLLQSISNAWKH